MEKVRRDDRIRAAYCMWIIKELMLGKHHSEKIATLVREVYQHACAGIMW